MTKKITKLMLNGQEYEIREYQPGGWQPGADTVAYYPLDSTNTVNDLSGNNYNLTNYNATFGTYQGVDCAFLDPSISTPGLYYSGSQVIPNGEFTWSCRIYIISMTGNARLCSSWGGNPFGILEEGGDRLVVYSSTTSTGLSTQIGAWHLYTITGDFSQGSYVGYLDGQINNTWSGNSITNGTGLNIGGLDSENSASTIDNKLNAYISNFVLEDKARTAQEVSDYFNQTKSLYGIS